MDDRQSIVLVETRTHGNDPSPRQLITYQLGNHLGSASLDLDHEAQIISYEEYYPYGSTSYQAVRSRIQVPIKRYRYTKKERDEESGFYYHGARYYLPWIARWLSADPGDLADGINQYSYTRGNPIIQSDPTGLQGESVIYHRTTEQGARTMMREGVSTTRSRPHVWAGQGFYASSSPDIPSSVGAQGNTIVAQRISTERMAEITDPGFIRMQQDTPEGRELRRLTRQQMRDKATQVLRTQGRMPSDADVDLRMRDYMSSQMDKLAPGADVVRWKNPDGTYTYVVRQQSALRSTPTIVGQTEGGRFRPLESSRTRKAAPTEITNQKPTSGRAGSVGPKAMGTTSAVADAFGIYTAARDMQIAERGGRRAGVAILEDENGEYILQKREGFIFDDYFKTYVSGDLRGKTSELGFFEYRKEIKKRDEKYGSWDWKGDLVPGKVPPIIVPAPPRDDWRT
jgi:RHS repeat-associated protein